MIPSAEQLMLYLLQRGWTICGVIHGVQDEASTKIKMRAYVYGRDVFVDIPLSENPALENEINKIADAYGAAPTVTLNSIMNVWE